ncbi:MAG: catechol 1,2-dioxygenase [Acidobacteria bacterium RIFCSPLOWO2_12_FULL_60_22]|nr:MAG: catechol 1,2-dioxygenase [Acidobacteria bacterium RIFCSPLOWO2_12_FULL_60_22]
MIIQNEREVTAAVLDELAKAPDARFREVLSAFVRHLHEFAREVKLTEEEFQRAIQYVVALGQHTTGSHNEAVLMSGSLGFSTLICLLNNGSNGQAETMANLLGPFWRLHSPRTENGGSIVRSPTEGPPLFVNACVRDTEGQPVEGAEVDVWHSSPEGFYDVQDPSQADMNLRGKFMTDTAGCFSFRSVRPSGYPIPVSGPVGELLRAQGRHNMRPAHLHFLIFKPGFKTLISQVYRNDDPYLERDVQFGVTKALVGNYVCHDGAAPAPGVNGDVSGEWYSLDQTFLIEPGNARLPKPPIQ